MVRTKHLLPIFDPARIQDHNSEGFDSVDSEDFDPGFGCVPVYVERMPTPPPVPDTFTESDRQNIKYFFTTDAEKEKQQDEFLKQFGL